MSERARRSRNDGDEHATTISVLYVDVDAATRERIRAAMTEHRPALSVSGVASVTAGLDVVGEAVPACLVVDPDGLSEIDRLLDAVSCPILLYTSRDPSVLDQTLVETADSVIEKDGSRRGEFLAEKVVSAADTTVSRSEYALEAALERIHGRADEVDLAMLVDDGRIVWSSEPPEQVLGETDDSTTVYDRLAKQCDTTEASLIEQLRADPTEPVRVHISNEEGEQHQLWRGYDLPEAADSLRLLLVSEISERAQRQARLSRLELLVEQAQDGLYTLDERGVIDFCNDSFAEMLGYDNRESVIGKHAAETLAPGELEKGQETIEKLLAADSDNMMAELTFVRTDGTEFEASIHYTLLRDEGEAYNGLMGVLRDVSEQKERQRTLESQRDELATLAQVHVLIQDVIRALGSAATRAEIEENVCSRLTDSDLYEVAWMGEREASGESVTSTTVAGDESARTVVSEQASGDGVKADPVTAAIRDGVVQVVDDIGADERPIPWRATALDQGLHSAVVVPLRHDGVIHGVLTVCASQQEVFSGRAVDAFATLGEMVSFAFTALQSRQLLAEDRVVEMEFRSVDDAAYPIAAARADDGVCRRSGGVAVGDEVLEYLTVEGVEPSAALEPLFAHDPVRDGRVIRSEDDSGVIELRMAESYQSVLLDAGARLVDVVADADGVRVTLEAPTDAEPRTIKETLSDHVPGFELVAKQERERRAEPDDSRSSVREELTDRQLEVLRAASLAGYYEWPRDTTAEELADTLDIASPTLHQHLRRAERNVLDGLLDN